MLPTDLLKKVVQVLEALDVPYFLTGSAATSIYGEPRFTNDIDIVAALLASKAKLFCAAFPEEEFYVSEEGVAEAIRRGGQFNIIHPASGLKADLMVPSRSSLAERSHRLRLHSRMGGATGCAGHLARHSAAS
jgi:hypothetical protein